jgi:hypothetical protein
MTVDNDTVLQEVLRLHHKVDSNHSAVNERLDIIEAIQRQNKSTKLRIKSFTKGMGKGIIICLICFSIFLGFFKDASVETWERISSASREVLKITLKMNGILL